MGYLQLLLLLIAANGAPILGRLLLGKRWATPIDRGMTFADDRPLLGNSKTYRGLAFGVVIPGLVAEVLALPFEIGLLMGGLAMCGDCLSSFLKRRFGLSSGAMAFGLDQIPESVFPLIGVKSIFHLTGTDIVWLGMIFILLELGLSFFFYKLHLRKHPY